MFDNFEVLDKCPICEKDIVISYKQVDFACSDKDCPIGHGTSSILSAMKDICTILNKIYSVKAFWSDRSILNIGNK